MSFRTNELPNQQLTCENDSCPYYTTNEERQLDYYYNYGYVSGDMNQGQQPYYPPYQQYPPYYPPYPTQPIYPPTQPIYPPYPTQPIYPPRPPRPPRPQFPGMGGCNCNR